MSTVLVTGANGFTGVYLANALSEWRPRDRVVLSGFSENDSRDFVACDLGDREQVEALVSSVQPDHVVHLAGLTFVGHPRPLDFFRVNVLGTENLLRALGKLRNRPEKVIVAGSANVYGAAAQEVISEDLCPIPVNLYASSKLAQEHVARSYFGDLPIIVTRPFNYTGRGQSEKFVIPKIVRHFQEGAKVIKLGNIDVERDFSDVRDIVDIYVSLLYCNASSTVVNLCSGHAVSIREVIRELEKIAGYTIEVHQDEKFLRRNEIPSLRGDLDHLESLIGKRDRIPMSATLEWVHRER